MAQPVKNLLCKHEDFNPKAPVDAGLLPPTISSTFPKANSVLKNIKSSACLFACVGLPTQFSMIILAESILFLVSHISKLTIKKNHS